MIFGPTRQSTPVDGPAQHPPVVTGAPWHTVVELIRGLLFSAQNPPNNGERRVRAPEAWDVPRSGTIISSRTILSEIIVVRQETQEFIKRLLLRDRTPTKRISRREIRLTEFFSHRDNPQQIKMAVIGRVG